LKDGLTDGPDISAGNEGLTGGGAVVLLSTDRGVVLGGIIVSLPGVERLAGKAIASAVVGRGGLTGILEFRISCGSDES
jgi:hypothetical protein